MSEKQLAVDRLTKDIGNELILRYNDDKEKFKLLMDRWNNFHLSEKRMRAILMHLMYNGHLNLVRDLNKDLFFQSTYLGAGKNTYIIFMDSRYMVFSMSHDCAFYLHEKIHRIMGFVYLQYVNDYINYKNDQLKLKPGVEACLTC